MTSPHTRSNVYNTSKRDNLILQDLEGPETNIPLPQLADTIRREGMTLFHRQRKPDPDAPTLMELYRKGVKQATGSRHGQEDVAMLEETSKPRPATTRKSGLKNMAEKKGGKAQSKAED